MKNKGEVLQVVDATRLRVLRSRTNPRSPLGNYDILPQCTVNMLQCNSEPNHLSFFKLKKMLALAFPPYNPLFYLLSVGVSIIYWSESCFVVYVKMIYINATVAILRIGLTRRLLEAFLSIRNVLIVGSITRGVNVKTQSGRLRESHE